MGADLLTARGARVTAVLGILLCGMAASPLHAETFEGCSWTGPDPDWIFDRTLPAVDLVGTLGSEVIGFLHDAGTPVSFISATAKPPEVRIQSSEPTTIRELLDEVTTQTPGYQLDVVDGKLVIYPLGEGYDALVDLGNPREIKRVSALFSVIRELRSKSLVLRGLRLPTLRPFGGLYGDLISVGGARTVVEHLASLVAGSPSATFLMLAGADGSMDFGLMWADVIEDLLLVVPEKVEVREEFQVIPRVIIAGGTPVTLIGLGCGVDYESTDESILKIDRSGRAVAITKGAGGVQAKYEAQVAYAKIEVTDD